MKHRLQLWWLCFLFIGLAQAAFAIATPTPDSVVICQPGTATLTTSGARAGERYLWFRSRAVADSIAGQNGNTLALTNVRTISTYYVAIDSAGTLGPLTRMRVMVLRPNTFVDANSPLNTAMLAKLSFHKGTLRDSKPAGLPTALAVSGTAVYSSDRFGYANSAIQYTSANQPIVAINQSFTNPRTFTLFVRFRTTSNAGGNMVNFQSSTTGTGGNHDRKIFMRDGGRISFGVFTGSELVITSNDSYNDGVWHSAAATMSTAGMRLYIDGQLVGSSTNTVAENFTGFFRLGPCNSWAGASTNMALGQYDDFTVWPSTALTADQVADYDLGQNTIENLTPSLCGGGLPAFRLFDSRDDVLYRIVRPNGNKFPLNGIRGNGDTLSLVDVDSFKLNVPATYAIEALAFTDTTNCKGSSNPFSIAGGAGFNTAPTVLVNRTCGRGQLVLSPQSRDASSTFIYSLTPSSLNPIAGLPSRGPANFGQVAEGTVVNYYVFEVGATGCVSPPQLISFTVGAGPRNQTIATTVNSELLLNFNGNFNNAFGPSYQPVFAGGTPRYSTGRFTSPALNTGAINFNGISENLRLRNALGSPASMTYSVWVKADTMKGGVIAALGNNRDLDTSSLRSRILFLDDSLRLRFQWNAGTQVSSLDKLPSKTWVHVAVTANASGVRLYVNGQQVAVNTTPGTAVAMTAGSNQGYVKLGSENLIGVANAPATIYFRGQMSNFWVDDRIFTAAEIQSLATQVGVYSINRSSCNAPATGQVVVLNPQPGVAYSLVQVNDTGGIKIVTPVVNTNNRKDSLVLPVTIPIGFVRGVRVLARDSVSGCTTLMDTVSNFSGGQTLVAATVSSQSSCKAQAYTLVATHPNPSARFTWRLGSSTGTVVGTGGSFTTPVIPNNDSLVYVVTVADTIGCPATSDTRVVAKTFFAPMARISGDPVNISNLMLSLPLDRTNLATATAGSLLPYVGNVVNATLTSNRLGQVNQAYQFNGTNAQLTGPRQITLPADFSYSVWFRTDDPNSGKLIGIGSSQTGTSTGFDRHLYLDDNGRLAFGYWTGSPNVVTAPPIVRDNQWHHAVAVRSGGNLSIYIDGQLAVTNTFTATSGGTTNWLRIGFDNLGGWPNASNNYFRGAMDEITIIGKAVTAAEVTALYQGGITQVSRTICGSGNPGFVAIARTQRGVNYQLVTAGLGTLVASIADTGNAVLLSTGVLTTDSSFRVKLTTANGCDTLLDSVYTFRVVPAAPIVRAVKTDYTKCGAGSETLLVTGAQQGSYRWYAAATGGISINSDSSFTGTLVAVGDSLVYFVSSITADGCEGARTKVKVTAVAAATDPRSPGPVANLFASYPFVNSLADVSANNITLALRGTGTTPVYSTDKFGRNSNALVLSGVSGTGYNVNRQVNNPQVFAYSIWFRTSTARGGHLIAFGTNPTTNSGSHDRKLYMLNTGAIVAGIYTGNQVLIQSSPGLNDGNWHHAAMTYNAGDMRLFIDGVQVARNASSGAAQNMNGYFKIGYESTWGGLTQGEFTGEIDNAQITVGGILSPAEVLSIFRSGAGVLVRQPSFCGVTSANTEMVIYGTSTNSAYELSTSTGQIIRPLTMGTADSLVIPLTAITTNTVYNLRVQQISSGCELKADTVARVTLNPVPAAPGVNDTTRCGVGTAVMRASGAVSQDRYVWYSAPTGGTPLNVVGDRLTTASIAAGDSLISYVSIIAATGCESPRTRVRARAIALPARPSIVATPTNATACAGDSVLLTAPAGFATYVWQQGAVTLPFTTRSIWAKTPGNYSVNVVTAEGCRATQGSPGQTVIVNPKPTVSIAFNNATQTFTATPNPTTGTYTYQWFNGTTQITGQAGATYRLIGTGCIRVRAVRIGCVSDSSNTVCITSAGELLTQRTNMEVYPNPNDGQFTIALQTDLLGAAKVSVVDMLGRVVYDQAHQVSAAKEEWTLRLNEQPAGVYYVRIQQGERMLTKRINIAK